MTPETEIKAEDEKKRVPCMHDPRPFLNVMPQAYSMDAAARKRLMAAEFFPTCPYMSVEGSIYCAPHTIMNMPASEIKGELARLVEGQIENGHRLYAQGYLIIPPANGRMFLPAWWPHRFDSFGPYGKR